MKKLLLIALLIVGCDNSTEAEDCAGVAGGSATNDDCGNCSNGNENYTQGDMVLSWPIDCIPGNDCDLGHADINEDDAVDIQDLLILVNYILNGP